MLTQGIKGGQLLDATFFNRLTDIAEQVLNINVTGKFLSLTDNQSSSLENKILHFQHRDNLALIGVFISESSSFSPSSPKINKVLAYDSTDLTSYFTQIDNSTDMFDFQDSFGNTYYLYLAKRTYSVSTTAKTRIKIEFDAIDTTIKNLDNSYFKELLVIQFDDTAQHITRPKEGELSTSETINGIKAAFNKRNSYNLTISNANNEVFALNFDFLKRIYIKEDLYEIGFTGGSHTDLRAEIFPDTTDDNETHYDRAYIRFSYHLGTKFNFANFIPTDSNFANFYNWVRKNLSSTLGFWHYIDTENYLNTFISDSDEKDPINAYDMFYFVRNLSDTLKGRLEYPVIGRGIFTEENTTGIPINATVVVRNNSDLIFDRSFKLPNNYPVKFAIVI